MSGGRVRAGALGAALLACGSIACFHTTKVDKDQDAHDAKTQAPAPANGTAQPKQSEGGASEQPKVTRRPERPGRPGLAAAPSGLFVPGGVTQVQQALASRGYLDLSQVEDGRIDLPTTAAVRRFQEDQGLARTGNPDHETVRRLGIDPDALFRKSSDAKKRAQ